MPRFKYIWRSKKIFMRIRNLMILGASAVIMMAFTGITEKKNSRTMDVSPKKKRKKKKKDDFEYLAEQFADIKIIRYIMMIIANLLHYCLIETLENSAMHMMSF